jgi:hypothetical protein
MNTYGMSPLFINISSDKVALCFDKEEMILERNGIEDVLGKVLVQWWKRFGFTEATILNGP